MSGARIVIDRTPLDLRVARIEEGKVTRLRHHLPARGTLLLGTVAEVKAGRFDPRLGGSFCEAGGIPCFLAAKGGPPPAAGTRFLAEVKREAIGDKAAHIAQRPALRLPFATLRLDGSGRVAAGPLGELPAGIAEAARDLAAVPAAVPPLLTLLAPLCAGGVESMDVVCPDDLSLLRPLLAPFGIALRHAASSSVRPLLDAAEEEALARIVPLKGGGRLVIDEAEAVTAIDVDLGAADGRSKAGAAVKAGEAAFAVLSKQAGLRDLGGQIILDLPRAAIRSPKIVRDQTMRALSALGRISVPAVTGEGLVVAIAPRPRPSLKARLTESFGEGVEPGRRLAADVLAAKTYRVAEAALETQRTARILLSCHGRAGPYLSEEKHVLEERYGPRLDIRLTDEESIDAR